MARRANEVGPQPDGAEPKHCFAPIVDRHSRLLVLGSLPGEMSLAREQYYGNPRNQFWSLMTDVLGTDLVSLDYPQRLRTLIECRVGLWDVIASATRTGSLDAAIRDPRANALAALVEGLPELRAVAFNGRRAAAIGCRQLESSTKRLITLPSSSPAHAIGLAAKKTAWLQLRAWL